MGEIADRENPDREVRLGASSFSDKPHVDWLMHTITIGIQASLNDDSWHTGEGARES